MAQETLSSPESGETNMALSAVYDAVVEKGYETDEYNISKKYLKYIDEIKAYLNSNGAM